MKKIFLILVVLITTSSISFAQTHTIDCFYKKYKRGNPAHVSLGGGLIRFVALVGMPFVEKGPERSILNLARRTRGVKVLVSDALSIKAKDYRALLSGLRKEHFEEYISIRSKETKANILIREHKTRIKNIFILAEQESELVMVSLATNIHYEELEELIELAIAEDW